MRSTGRRRPAVRRSTREPVHIPDVRDDPEYAYGGPTEYYRSLLGVPIMVEDELIGVVVLVRREPEPFTDEHIALVQTFADQAAIAVANARLIDAVERQRTELARFVSPQVAELISSRDGEQLLAGHRAYISCLFCDLRGFTAFAETAAPEELFDVLREYHGALGDAHPRVRRDARALRRRRRDGVLQRSCRRRRPRAPGRPARARRAGAVRGARRGRGASVEPSSGSESASRPATRRSVGSASKAATTTACSGRSRTSPRGSARRRRQARS